MWKVFCSAGIASTLANCYIPKNNLFGPYNEVISGESNTAIGAYNVFDGDSNFAHGDGNYFEGDSNQAIGNGNVFEGDNNKVIGEGNCVKGKDNMVQGEGNFVDSGDSEPPSFNDDWGIPANPHSYPHPQPHPPSFGFDGIGIFGLPGQRENEFISESSTVHPEVRQFSEDCEEGEDY